MAASDQVHIQFGWYRHPIGTTAYTLQRQAIFDGLKLPRMEDISITLEGMIYADNTSDLESRWIELNLAYRQINADFAVVVNGIAPVTFAVLSATTIGGIRVVQPPSRPNTRNGAHHKYLPFTIGLQARVLLDGTPHLLSFRETISWKGGGPRTSMIEAIYGPPIKQQTRQHTIYRATQSGQAVSIFGIPQIPEPIWPSDWTGDYQSSRTGPDEIFRDVGTGRAVSWSYEFESASPLNGLPNEWGVSL